MKKEQFENQEITWRTIVKNVDIETGELLNNLNTNEYEIISRKKFTNKYRTTGTVELTNECRKRQYKQGTLFN